MTPLAKWRDRRSQADRGNLPLQHVQPQKPSGLVGTTTRRSLLAKRMEQLWFDGEAVYREQILKQAAATADVSVMLDVGCDDGDWAMQVAEAVPGIPRVVGLEAVEDRADLARQRGIDTRIADLELAWPVDDESCDLVHANQVIEHVKRLDHFAAETRRVLRPGGMAIICTENLASWHNLGATALGWMPFSLTNISAKGSIGNPLALHAGELNTRPESWQHIHVVTLRALSDLFTVHGFEVVARFGGGYHPFWGRVGRSLAKRDPRHSHFIGVTVRRPGQLGFGGDGGGSHG